MTYLIIAAFSAGLTSSIMKAKGRSPVAGFVMGLLLSIFGIVIALVLKPVRKGSKVKSDSSPRTTATEVFKDSDENVALGNLPSSGEMLIPPSGYFSQTVAGESFHFTQISQVLISLLGNKRGEIETVASLIPEPTNKFDPDAIAVVISGLTCGYIPRADTARIRPLIELAAKKSKVLVAGSRVWGGDGTYSDNDWIGSVSLDIPFEAASLFPVNEISGNAVLWPEGGQLKVTESASASLRLLEIIGMAHMEGVCRVYLDFKPTLSDKGKGLAGVFFSETLVGTLSPSSSNKFLPLMEKLNPLTPLSVLATVRGNAIATEVTVHALSPERLSAAQISSLGLA